MTYSNKLNVSIQSLNNFNPKPWKQAGEGELRLPENNSPSQDQGRANLRRSRAIEASTLIPHPFQGLICGKRWNSVTPQNPMFRLWKLKSEKDSRGFLGPGVWILPQSQIDFFLGLIKRFLGLEEWIFFFAKDEKMTFRPRPPPPSLFWICFWVRYQLFLIWLCVRSLHRRGGGGTGFFRTDRKKCLLGEMPGKKKSFCLVIEHENLLGRARSIRQNVV